MKPRIAVQELAPYVCARDLYKQGKVLLDANENAFASASIEGVSLNRYPDPECTSLRQALAEYCGAAEAKIIVGNGSDEIISMAISAFCGEGDNVVSVQPGYSMYGVLAKAAGAQERQCVLEEGFQLDAEKVLKTIDSRTKIIFVVSPNSVTGAEVDRKEIRKLLEGFDGAVFVDEAYYEYCGESVAGWTDECDNLVVSRTLSKAWGLAALRIGYCISSGENIAAMRKVKLPYNVNALSQEVAARFLRTGRQAMLENVQKTIAEREVLCAQLATLGLEVFASSANFVAVRFPQGISSVQVQQMLAERGVIVRDRSSLPSMGNCSRITVGTPQENAVLLRELREILTELGK